MRSSQSGLSPWQARLGRACARFTPKLRVSALAVCSLAGAVALQVVPAATAQVTTQKIIEGKVFDDGSTPQPGAIVYLKSVKSNTIKSYIAAADGGYRFGQLATDTDYIVWAELHGKKSASKTITAFDTKRQFLINLHITDKTK